MKIEKLGFGHKDLLYDALKKVNTPISEYSFSNLYLFRNVHDYEVILAEDIFIKGKTYDGFSYIMPASNIENLDLEYLKHLKKNADFVFPVAEEWLGYFDKCDFEASYHEGDIDYMYTVEKMSTYKGGKLHKKRNLLKQFVSQYEHQDCPLTNDKLDDAREILNTWQDETAESKESTDYYPCVEALEKYEDLVLCGGIYYVEKEPAGFIIGEEINHEVFALHFAKAKRKFKGIYQYMYNTFAKILPEKYTYMNFEQDLGKTALRIAKSSYVPDVMLKKYRVKCK